MFSLQFIFCTSVRLHTTAHRYPALCFSQRCDYPVTYCAFWPTATMKMTCIHTNTMKLIT